MNKTYQDMIKYHDMVERAYARMDYLAEQIGIAKYQGRYVDAEYLRDEWELWAERKAIALSNEIDCLELLKKGR